ncbi:MAG: acetylglutamate kinase [Phycisphaeraceae bacterium]|nr:acetylglutamate kinase [Phycisphaeraceae bacterium]
MQEAIAKAEALVEAHQYIRRFQDKVVVVKVGGSIMDEPAALRSLLGDISFLATVGMRPVLVHGGGKNITEAMQKAGLEAQFVQGRRYTDERTLAIAEHVLVREVNEVIVKEIEGQGHRAMGLHSLASCAVFARRLYLTVEDGGTSGGGDGGRSSTQHAARCCVAPEGGTSGSTSGGGSPSGGGGQRKIDIGFVGEVEWVNGNLLRALVEAKCVPVIAPIARDSAGGKLNVNADSVAGFVAAAMKAEKLVLVSDTHGIRTDAADAESLAMHLTRAQIGGLIEKKVITSGMLPKVEAAVVALEGGVNKVHIIDGRIGHSLLLEIYTEKGIGTEIVL